MAIKFNGQDLQKRIINGQQVQKVMYNGTQIRPTGPAPSTEYIEYVMTADSSGNLYVPLGGYSTSGNRNCVYDWKVSVDGGTPVQYSGTGSSSGRILLSGYTSGQDYTIKIEPTTEGYLWARAYGRKNMTGRTYLKSVIYDGSYMGYAQSATATGAYFRALQYEGCSNLTSAPAEVLPNTVTSIGNKFRESQYENSGLTEAPYEVLPNSVTTISNDFRSRQYYGCASLTTIHDEVMPNSVTSIGEYFRNRQYNLCTSLTSSANEVLSSGVTYINNYFRYYQYQGCSSITSLGTFAGSSTATQIGNYYRSYQFGSTALVNVLQPEETLSSVTSIGRNFKSFQFNRCASLVNALTEVAGGTSRTVGNYYKYGQYEYCTSLQTTGGEADNTLLTSIGTYFRTEQYQDCYSLVTATMTANVNSNSSANWRAFQFSIAGQSLDQIRIVMNGSVVDYNGDNCDFNVNFVLEMVISDSSLLSSYQNDANWSSLSSKMVSA